MVHTPPELFQRNVSQAPMGVRPKRVLAVIDDEASIAPMLQWATRDAAGEAPFEVVLLAVQPRPETTRTRGIFLDKVRQHLEATARQRLDAMDRALTEAGVDHTVRIEIADEAEAVLRSAREERCELIIMVGKPVSAVRRRWLETTGVGVRSAVSQVVDLAEGPVLVLKGELH